MPHGRTLLMRAYSAAEYFRLGMAKTVDGLLDVADDKKIPFALQKINETVLKGADILIFIHENQRKKLLIASAHGGLDRRFVRKKPEGKKKEVLKIIGGQPSFLRVHHRPKTAHDAHKLFFSLYFIGHARNLENAFISPFGTEEVIEAPYRITRGLFANLA